jgi:hypothetical protein
MTSYPVNHKGVQMELWVNPGAVGSGGSTRREDPYWMATIGRENIRLRDARAGEEPPSQELLDRLAADAALIRG